MPQELPLLPEQQRFWFLQQLALDGQQNTVSLVCQIPNEVNQQHLQQRLNQLTQQYDILNMVIHQNGDQVLQQIAAKSPGYNIQVTNGNDLQKHIAEASQSVTQKEPLFLFRADLLKMPETQDYLLLTASRILYDIVSLEHIAAYLANSSDGMHLQEKDFATYIESKSKADTQQNNLEKWARALSDATVVCELPLDKTRPSTQQTQTANYLKPLSDATAAYAAQIAEKHNVPVLVVYMAAYFTLLYRYTLQDDILIGLASRDSNTPPIGPFTNLAIIRQKFADDINFSFADLLQSLASTYSGILETPPPSFASLLETFELNRDLSRAPIVQHGFAFQDSTALENQLKRIYTSPMLHQMDIMLHIRMENGTTTADWQYDPAIFNKDTLQRLHSHLEEAIASAATDASGSLRNLTLISPEEKEMIGVQWNDTTQPVPDNDLVYRLFEKQAERTPQAIAARMPGSEITYDDQNRRANRLAHFLKDQGVSTNQIVPILAQRNIDYQTAMLGINKAGGAFLPLSPEYPIKRLASIFEKSEAPIILVDDTYMELVTEAVQHVEKKLQPQIRLIASILEEDLPEDNLPVVSGMNDLAYVMFTSGSTGEPKGVMVHHAGMINHNYAKLGDLEMGASDTLAQTSRQSFDIVVWQFLAPLIVGGSIYIMPDDIALDPSLMLQVVDNEGITVLQLVPVNIEALIDVVDAMGKNAPKLKQLRWMVPTGDALHTALCQNWLTLYPHTRMLNTYGATECSDDQCHYVIASPPSDSYRPVVMTVGRPIINTKVYILDEAMQIVPIGVIGELYVAGVGVGPGYLKDPERTEKTFVKNPFSNDPDARLYRSGDQARYLLDGSIEFIGRIGFMIKIRGMRIEPGEIQAVLGQHPKVAQTDIIVHEFPNIGTHMLAYVVPRKGESIEENDLRVYLRQYLPDYMIPSYLIFLDALPLNANGKIDRKALPIPRPSEMKSAIVEPRFETERTLLEIWQKLLNRKDLSIHDNFFDIGGNSLLAMRLFSQIERQFRQRLPLATIFRAATIADLSVLLSEMEEDTPIYATVPGTTSLVHIQAGSKKRPPFFCIHAQGGHVLYFAKLAHYLGEDQPFYGVQALGIDGKNEPKRRYEELAEIYVQEIRSVQPEGPYHVGGECMGGSIAFEVAHQLEQQGQKVNLLVMFDSFCAGVPTLKPGIPMWVYMIMFNVKRSRVLYFSQLTKVPWNEKKRFIIDIINRTIITVKRIFFSRWSNDDNATDPLTVTFVALAEAEAAYEPPVIDAQVTLFNSELPWGLTDDQTLGWEGHSKTGVRIYNFPILFDTMIEGRDVALAAEKLREVLDEIVQGEEEIAEK